VRVVAFSTFTFLEILVLNMSLIIVYLRAKTLYSFIIIY
jgi:hypothetical protein